MPRIIVTTDLSQLPDDTPVLLDEQVRSVHLSTGHAAAQPVERIAWAIGDAENAETSRLDHGVGRAHRSLALTPSANRGGHLPIGA